MKAILLDLDGTIVNTKQGIFNADPNGDQKINSSDALIILKISVGKIKL